MRFTDETLMAFADGELDEQTRRDVEQAMRRDPVLAAKVRQHLALRAQVFGMFDAQREFQRDSQRDSRRDSRRDSQRESRRDSERDSQPDFYHTSQRATHAEPPDNVVHLNTVRPLRCPPPTPQRRWSWPEWSAVLFALSIGFLCGALALLAWQGQRQIAAIDPQGKALSAQGALSTALSQQLAGAAPGQAGVSIGASFVSKEGNYCRSFMLPGVAGLACRRADHWFIPILAERAGSAMPTPVRDAIDARIAGHAFDANAEREAHRQHWKR